MSIETAKHTSREVQFKSDSFDTLLSNIGSKTTEQGYRLILIVGESEDKKEEAFNKIKEQTERDVLQVDANELLSANEAETRQRIDKLFNDFDAEHTILYVANGANLCGAFTGYTLSKVKYATPQERYFLKKIIESKSFTVIDFETIDSVDTTLNRASDAIVTFKVPDSGIKGLIARLKQIHVNGYDLNSKRPEKKELIIGNF